MIEARIQMDKLRENSSIDCAWGVGIAPQLGFSAKASNAVL